MSRKGLLLLVLTGALLVPLLPAPAAPPPRETTDEDLDRAIEEIRRYLWNKQGAGGHWSPETYNVPGGGATALACLALLEAGESPNDERMKKSLDALAEFKTENLYVVAVRVMALSGAAKSKESPYRVQLEKDVKWLTEKAQATGGAWGYAGPEKTGDNSCSQFALLALWEADRAGVTVDAALIRTVEQTWLRRQRSDGGWTYPGQSDVKAESTLTMTTAGLASLYICQEVLNRSCQPYPHRQAADGAWAYLDKNLKDDYFRNDYLAFCVQRVGLASGQKFIAGMDWFATGAGKLVEPNPYGRSFAGQWGPIVRASFDLIFLARGRIPLTINKLRHGDEANWNVHTRDVPAFTEYMRRHFERPMRWQVVGIEDEVAMLLDAPILLVTGTEGLDFSPAQWDKLRQYALRGGTLLILPTHGSKAFFDSASRSLEDLFAAERKLAGGHYALQPLPGEHPLYRLHEAVPNGPVSAPAWGVSDGTRLLAVLCQRDLACAWQKRQPAASRIEHALGVNLFLYATGGNSLRMRLRPVFFSAGGEARSRAKVAWLKHGGNWCSQPYALSCLADKLLAENRLALEVTFGAAAEDKALSGHDLVWLVGSSAFSFSEAELAALRRYLDEGGTLFVNAVGGSRDFAASADQMLEGLFAGRDAPMGGPGVDSPLVTGKCGQFRGPALGNLARTRAWARLSSQAGAALRVYREFDRPVVVHCPYGVHDTLDGHTADGAVSYMPASARDLAANVVLCAMMEKPRVATRPASAPGPGSAPASSQSRPAPATTPSRPSTAP